MNVKPIPFFLIFLALLAAGGGSAGGQSIDQDLRRAEELSTLGNWSEAKDTYQAAMSAAEVGSDEWQTAVIGYLDCLEDSPDADYLLAEAERLADEASEYPRVLACALFRAGHAHQKLEHPDEALKYYDRVESTCPEEKLWVNWTRFERAKIYWPLGLEEKFFALLDGIVGGYPQDATLVQFTWASYERANRLREKHRFSEAIAQLEHLFQVNPNFNVVGGLPSYEPADQARELFMTCCEEMDNRRRAVRFTHRMLSRTDLDQHTRSDWEDKYDQLSSSDLTARDVKFEVAVEEEWGDSLPEGRFAQALEWVRTANGLHSKGEIGKALMLYRNAIRSLGLGTKPGPLVADWIVDAYVRSGSPNGGLRFARAFTRMPWDPGNEEQKQAAAWVAALLPAKFDVSSVLQWYCFLAGVWDTDPTGSDAEVLDQIEPLKETLASTEALPLERDTLLCCLAFFAGRNYPTSAYQVLDIIASKYGTDPVAAARVLGVLESLHEYPHTGAVVAPAALKFADLEPELLRLAGTYGYESGDSANAVTHLRKYLEICEDASHTAEVNLLLALALIDTGGREAAREILKKLTSEFSDSKEASRAQFLLAYDSINSGEYARASRELEVLLERYPESKEADQARVLLETLSPKR